MKHGLLIISYKNMVLVIGIVFIVCGILSYKYPDLIAGYNTLPAEKKELLDTDKLKKHVCMAFVLQGLIMIITQVVLYSIHKENIANVLSFVWIPLFVVFLFVMVNCVDYKK